jgi:ribonuclease BN (tRNA processing enzyme)
MRLTVLGKSPAWQDAGGACSGYLLEDGGTAMLVDCGNGVFGKLREHIDYVDVDAVVISHLHADHFLDLVPYSYALTYAPRQQPVPVDGWPGTDNPARPDLHAPPGARDTFRRVVGAWGNDDLIENAFHLREYDASSELEIGPLRVRFQPVPHFTETFAMRLSSRNGSGQIVYGADCSPTDALTDFAGDADLMLVESTLPRPERTGKRGHLTPGEAGVQARAAGAKRLLLVHISDELDSDWARAEAERSFGGPVEVAREGAVYEVR